MKTKLILTACFCILHSSFCLRVEGQGTAFTYQGLLNFAGSPASGTYDLKFTLYGAASGGAVAAGPVTNSAVTVSNGLFTTAIDFGTNVFAGADAWLHIGVRTNGATSFTGLTPRQELTPAPYAEYAPNAGAAATAGSVAATNISGIVPLSELPAGVLINGASGVSLSGAFTGDGSGLTGFNASNLVSGTIADARLSTNVALLNANETFRGTCVFSSPLGVGMSPVYTLDVRGGQGVGRFISTNNSNGSVIELRNNSASPTILGAINFNNPAGTYPGQISYQNAGALTFRVAGIDPMMQLDTSGLGIAGDVTCSNLFMPAAGYNVGMISFGGFVSIYGVGYDNFFAGMEAGNSTMTGSDNTGIGSSALVNNTSGDNNVAIGPNALHGNQGGSYNVGVGSHALFNNQTGSRNTALGYTAGYSVANGSDNIHIYHSGYASDSGVIRIGVQGTQTSTYIAGIFGSTASSGVPVYVNSSGQLGTLTSSRRFKQDIQDMRDASDALLALRPVTFRYRSELDPQGIPQFGLIAEEVEKAAPALVARDDQGEPYTVRYEAVNAMLLNEFLKQHRTVEEQSAQIATLTTRLEKLEQRLNQKNGGAQ